MTPMLDTSVNVSDNEFDSVLARHPIVVVDFWAPHCPPCHVLSPIIEALAKEHAGRILFAKMNADENPTTATKYGIMALPTLLVIKDGQPVDQIIGAVPKARIESVLARQI